MPHTPRYEDITETAGGALTAEAAAMMYTRYDVAARVGRARRVLEVGCGAGLGLGLIAREARLAVGGDYSMALLAGGRRHYRDRVPFVRLSAEALPFRPAAFDVVLCFEATYYIPNMNRAFDEITRVLAPGGEVVFVNANPDRPDFVKSPFSVHYHNSDEFRAVLEQRGFAVAVEGAFAVREGGRHPLLAAALPAARKVLQAWGLVPRTLAGRARLKRLLFGPLRAIPPEIPPNFAPVAPRTALPPGPAASWKVIYVRGIRR